MPGQKGHTVVFVVTMIDPTGRVAGKSYVANSTTARQVGLQWRNVYAGNRFTVRKERDPFPTQRIVAAGRYL